VSSSGVKDGVLQLSPLARPGYSHVLMVSVHSPSSVAAHTPAHSSCSASCSPHTAFALAAAAAADTAAVAAVVVDDAVVVDVAAPAVAVVETVAVFVPVLVALHFDCQNLHPGDGPVLYHASLHLPFLLA